MADIRREETHDGRCTIYIGTQIIIADLSPTEADAIVAMYGQLATL